MNEVKRFLKQPSTQRMIAMFIGILGWYVSPENLESITAGFLALIAAIEGFRDEDKPIKIEPQRAIVVRGPTDGDEG